jgi:hypothetical protein
MLNFPDSPAVDQVFASGAVAWRWDGGKWVVKDQTSLSGMVAGQIPIAASATAIASSANLSGDVSSNAALVTTLTSVNGNVGTFQGITVNAKGLVTAATNQSYLIANQTITLTGDVTGSGTTTIATTLATVPVAKGGTNKTSWVAGSVAFAASATALGEDNANLFFDNTNKRLGIGTAAPASALSVTGLVGLQVGGMVGFAGATVAPTLAIYSLYGDTTSTALNVRTGGSVQLKVNNVEYMRVDSTGNVGIGTTGPFAKLDIVGGGGSGAVRVYQTGQSPWPALNNNDVAISASAATQAYRINQDSTHGIYLAWVYNATVGSSYAILSTHAGNNNLVLQDAGGNVGIGTTGPNAKFHVRGQSAAGGPSVSMISNGPVGADSTSWLLQFTDYGAGTTCGIISRTGTNSVAYQTTSDARLKDAITESNRGLDALMQIKVSDYDMGETHQQGLLAQDVHQIYPEAVHEGGEDPNLEPWMIDYGRLTPLLIKSIQQLSDKLEAAEAEIATLRAER